MSAKSLTDTFLEQSMTELSHLRSEVEMLREANAAMVSQEQIHRVENNRLRADLAKANETIMALKQQAADNCIERELASND